MQPSFTVASSDGVTIAGYEHGGSGDTLLIAHATGFCGPMYDDVAALLTDQFRVVSLDFRGHGKSTRPANDDFSWQRMTDDLLVVVQHIVGPAGAPIHAVGHSMGGATLLLGELRHPGTFRSLYLFEPIVVPDEGLDANMPNFMADAARSRRPVFPSPEAALYRYASRPPLNQLRASALVAYIDNGFTVQADGSARLSCLPEDEARTFASPDKAPVSAMRAVSTPTVVAVGYDEAGPNPARFAPLVADAMPNCTVSRHPTLGHFGPFQDPIVVADDIRRHASAN